MPIIKIRLNDQVEAAFGVDTGFNTAVISEELALRLKLSPQPAVKQGRPYIMGDKQGRMVTLSRMQIGIFSINDQPVIVSDPHQLASLSPRSPSLDGIIGANILSVFSVLFDFPQRQITLWTPAGLTSSEITSLGMDGATILPLTERKDSLYTIPGKVWSSKAQANVDFLLDTGAVGTFLTVSLARKLQLVPQKNNTNRTYWGEIKLEEAQVGGLQLGDLTMLDRAVDYTVKEDARFPALIGMDILSGYRMLLDFSSKKMYLHSSLLLVKP